MKKTMKWLALSLATLTCVSFVGCKAGEESSMSDMASMAAKIYAAGYTEIDFYYCKEAEEDGEIGEIEGYNPTTDEEIEAVLFTSADFAKRYFDDENKYWNEEEDGVLKLFENWLLWGETAAGVNTFCSSSVGSASHELLTVFDEVCKKDFVCCIEGWIIEEYGTGMLEVYNETDDVVAACWFASAAEAQEAYAYSMEYSGGDIVARRGKWVIIGETQELVDAFIDILE